MRPIYHDRQDRRYGRRQNTGQTPGQAKASIRKRHKQAKKREAAAVANKVLDFLISQPKIFV